MVNLLDNFDIYDIFEIIDNYYSIDDIDKKVSGKTTKILNSKK